MTIAWRFVAFLSICALPMPAQAQFGGGGYGGYGYYGYGPTRQVALEMDDSIKPDYTPLLVLDAAGKRALANIVAALDRPMDDLEFEKLALSDCLASLQKLTGIRFSIDDNESIIHPATGKEKLITYRQRGGTLRTALDGILTSNQLDWTPSREGVVITTENGVYTDGRFAFVVVFPVEDLVAIGDLADFDSVIELITNTVEPNSWKEGGIGEGMIDEFPGSGSIIVTNSWRVQVAVANLLTTLRQAKVQQGIRGLRIVSEPATSEDDKRDALPPPTSRHRYRTRWAPREPNYSPPVVGGVF